MRGLLRVQCFCSSRFLKKMAEWMSLSPFYAFLSCLDFVELTPVSKAFFIFFQQAVINICTFVLVERRKINSTKSYCVR